MRLAVAASILVALGLAQAPQTMPRATAADSAGLVPAGRFYPTVVNPSFVALAGDTYAQHVQSVYAWRQRILYTYDDQSPSQLASYDADTFRPTAKKGLPLAGAVQTTLVDDATGTLFLTEGSGPTSTIQAARVVRGVPRLLGTLTIGARSLGDPNQSVVGIAWYRSPDVILLLSADVDATDSAYVPETTRLSAVDVRALASGRARVLWTQALTNCRVPATASTTPSSKAGLGYAPAAHAAYFGCSSVNGQGIYQPPDPIGIGKVVFRAGGSTPVFDHFELFPKAADFTSNGSSSMFDPASQRLVISESNTNRGTQVDAFQTGDDAFVGSAGAGGNAVNQWGLDPVHGRFYFAEANDRVGIAEFDTQATPLAQGATYPQYQNPPDIKGSNYILKLGAQIAVDPKTSRLLVDYATASTGKALTYLNVFRDEVPYFHELPPPNPDANTLNVPERAGVTVAQYSGSAQGYGAIYRQVGGIGNLAYNVFPIFNYDSALPIGGGTREFDAGYLGKLTLDGSEASAAAIADQTDSTNTGADLQTAHATWPFPQVSCVDFGGTRKAVQEPGATAECNQGSHTAAASALGGGSVATIAGTALGRPSSSAATVFNVGSSSVSARISMGAGHGTQTSVSSITRGITLLAGEVQIGELITSVTARAHGRPGTAHAVFTRGLQDVRLGGRLICAASCSADSVAATINAELPGRLRVDFPTPDPAPAKGSPGGYQAVVQRRLDQQVQEEQVNEQPTDRVEVPGMVVTVYEDNVVPSRTIGYFAGVEAEAYYGIYLLNSGGGGAGPSTNPAAPSTGPTAGVAPPPLAPTLPSAMNTPLPYVAVGPGRVLGAVRHGLHVLVNAFGRFFRLFGVWLLLLVPVYLSSRRWALLSRGLFYGGPR
jgi:hypothetical protein